MANRRRLLADIWKVPSTKRLKNKTLQLQKKFQITFMYFFMRYYNYLNIFCLIAPNVVLNVFVYTWITMPDRIKVFLFQT